VIYSTMRPCFGCTKELLQAHVQAVYFLHDWAHPDGDKQAEYVRLQARFPGGIRKLEMPDPETEWAVSALRSVGVGRVDETGHQP
jgi:dCMP deaminase